MTQPVTFGSLTHPLVAIVDKETGKNAGNILCPKETCRCIIIRKNAATLVERDGAKLTIPESSLPENNALSNDQDMEESHFWRLGDMMEFENIGFSKTVGSIKYLSCADCDIGPLGYHDKNEPIQEYLVSVRRARYQF